MNAYVSAAKRHLVKFNVRYLTAKITLVIAAGRIKDRAVGYCSEY